MALLLFHFESLAEDTAQKGQSNCDDVKKEVGKGGIWEQSHCFMAAGHFFLESTCQVCVCVRLLYGTQVDAFSSGRDELTCLKAAHLISLEEC